MNKQEQEEFDEREELTHIKEELDKAKENGRIRELQVNSMPYRDLPFRSNILIRIISILQRAW